MANDYETPGAVWAAEGDAAPATELSQAEVAVQTTETPSPAPAPATNEPAPTLAESSDKWARDEAGRFAPKEPTEETATEEVATDADRPATQAEIAAVVKASLNGKEIEIPENLMVPLKRNGQITMVPLKDVMASGMMEQDYRHKTSDLARQRQEVSQMNQQLAAERARAVEQTKILQEQSDAWQAAKRDPEKLAQWEAHFQSMKNNPMYAKAFNDSEKLRITEAENRALHEATEARQVQDTVAQLTQEITAIGAQYPDVDPKRIMSQYGLILKAGEIDQYDPQHIHQLFQKEAATYQSVVLPVRTELESLKAELAAIKKIQDATAANANTDKVLQRARAVNLGPAGTPPAHTAPPPKPYTPDQADQVRSDWIKAGR